VVALMAERPRTPDEERSSAPRHEAIVSVPGNAIRVLLVEDDDGDALLVDDLLSEALPGVRIARSRTFGDALSSLDAGIDCVLLDLQLPDAAGLDTVVRLRARAPATPLIVLTGLDDAAAGVAAVDAGAQDYLVKGNVDGAQLARAIRYAIVRRQAADAQHELRLADVQAREVARLERGLAPRNTAPGEIARCSEATSSMSSRHPSAVCGWSSAMSAATGRTRPRSASACVRRGGR
jgi:DNA-binding NarL/FixJ family response regulator